MEEKVIKKMDESIKTLLDSGLNTSNLDTLYKLSKIKHMAKEDEKMNYYGYYSGRNVGYDTYGREDYGRRGYDMRYRGHDELDRMADNYGRYMEGKMRYGAGNEDSKRSLKYMLESMEHFAHMLKEDAQNPEEVEMIKQTAQRIAQM